MKKLRLALKEFSTLPKKSKWGVVFLLLLIFIISFLVTVSYWQLTTSQIRRPRSRAKTPFMEKVETPVLASLSLVPQNQMVKKGDTFLVTVNIQTGDYKVDTADVVLTFDPQILTVEKISEGMFFTNYPIKKWEEGKVMITGTIGIEQSQTGGIKGEGPFATITFKALTDGVAQISFDANSLVASQGQNVLGDTKETKYEIY